MKIVDIELKTLLSFIESKNNIAHVRFIQYSDGSGRIEGQAGCDEVYLLRWVSEEDRDAKITEYIFLNSSKHSFI